TMVMGTQVAERSNSPVTVCVEPGLMVPTLNFCGSIRAASSASFNVLIGESAFTSNNRSNCAMVEIGANAVTGSNGMDFKSDFDSAIPLEKTNRAYPSGGDESTAAARARPVLDHDLRAGAFGQFLRQQANRDVGKTSGAERDHDADRTVGVGGLRMG